MPYVYVVPPEPDVDLDDRQSVIDWLCWNDHNGCYTDEDAVAEFGEGSEMTLVQALCLYRDQLIECEREVPPALVEAVGDTLSSW